MKPRLANIVNCIEKKHVLLITSLGPGTNNRFANFFEWLVKSGASLVLSAIASQNSKLEFFQKPKVNIKGIFRHNGYCDPVTSKRLTDYVLSRIPHVSIAVVWDNGELPQALMSQLEKVSEQLKIPFLYIADGNTNKLVKPTLYISEASINTYPTLTVSKKMLKLRLNNKAEQFVYLNKPVSFENVAFLILMGILKGFYSDTCLDYLKKCINS